MTGSIEQNVYTSQRLEGYEVLISRNLRGTSVVLLSGLDDATEQTVGGHQPPSMYILHMGVTW